MSHPEWPILAAGGLSITAGFAREKHWPANGYKAVLGTIALVVIASAAGGTKIGPFVTALAYLMLLGVAFNAIPALNAAQVSNRKKG